MNSDLDFNLLYNHNIPRDFISAAIDALEPFPRGLLTDIGQLVANPVYGPNHTKSEELGWGVYHGTVTWSLFALGVRRVVEPCRNQSLSELLKAGLQKLDWCGDVELFGSLLRAQANLDKAYHDAHTS
ncbi:hypothetical protein FRC10_002339 [Ceratobasidium sp. 414]|nr:hypothetical protein FRC10_002339 [Ceratobasidium sp. 414]